MQFEWDIPDEDLAQIDLICAERGIARNDWFLEALRSYVAQAKQGRPLVGFGAWKDFPEDGLEYQRRIRAEWDSDGD